MTAPRVEVTAWARNILRFLDLNTNKKKKTILFLFFFLLKNLFYLKVFQTIEDETQNKV